MSGNIDKPHLHVTEIQMRKSEVDGDSRSFSSFKRSGSVPVSALTRALFP